MKKYIYTFLLVTLVVNVAILQKGKSNAEVDPYQAFKQELAEYKKASRIALKPYRYDGIKTTYFSYKSFDYVKEVEVGTIQKAEYRLSFNANGIHYDKIKIRIYDKPKENKGRVLLWEKDGVGGNEFTCETGEMLDRLKEAKREKGVSESVINVMRLKKLYIDYIIPAVERETEIDEMTGNEIAIIKKGAIIVSVGYQNIPID